MGALCIVGVLAACGSTKAADMAVVVTQPKSRWVPVPWTDLPGWGEEGLSQAWNAWLKSCEKPVAPFAEMCADVRVLSIGTPQEQRSWMRERFQPYRVESLEGEATGLLTGYFEPLLEGSRTPTAQYTVPLYQPPLGLAQRKQNRL
jgi:membrane-bound lytic murein transglycosylase A